MSWMLVVLLLPLIVHAQQCDYDEVKIAAESSSFGAVEPFYDLAKSIIDGLQKAPSEEIVQDVNDLVFGDSDINTSDVIAEIVGSQIGGIIFWSIGFVVMIAALVLIIVTASCQCCATCAPPQTSYRKKYVAFILLGSLAVSFFFILISLIVYNVALTGLFDFMESQPVSSRHIQQNVDTLTSTGLNQFSCAANTSVVAYINQLQSSLPAYPDNVINQTCDQLDLTSLRQTNVDAYETNIDALLVQADKVIASLDPLTKSTEVKCSTEASTETTAITLTQDALKNIKLTLPTVRKSIDDFNDNVNDVSQQARGPVDDVSSELDKINDSINQIISQFQQASTSIQQDVNTTVNALDRAQSDFSETAANSGLEVWTRLAITLPLVVILSFAIVVFTIIVVIVTGAFEPPARLVATISIVYFYITLVLCILIMVAASISFIFGWGLSAVCTPLFSDSNYAVFRSVHTNVTVPGLNNEYIDINMRSLMLKCSVPHTTIFSALNGSNFYNVETVDDAANISQYFAIGDSYLKNIQFTFTQSTELSDETTALSQATDKLGKYSIASCKNSDDVKNDIDSYIKSLNDFISQLTALQTQLNNAEAVSNNQTLVNTLISNNDALESQQYSNFNQSLVDLFNSLQDEVFVCSPGVTIYKNAGDFFCDNFGKQFHGVWASIGLAAVMMIPLAVTFLFSYKWFSAERIRRTESVVDHSYSITPPQIWTSPGQTLPKGLRRNY